MSLILGLGSNLGNSPQLLAKAINQLKEYFDFLAISRIYQSEPVDYLEQPLFFNLVAEFKSPCLSPLEILAITQKIENNCGGHTDINKGPRYLDIDILFLGTQIVNLNNLQIPHPAIKKRSFVMLPLSELPFYSTISAKFPLPTKFSSWAFPIDPIN